VLQVRVENCPSLHAGACRVIAECGANHNNSVERAIEMAQRAAGAGAWAVKFQLYKADSLAVSESPKYWSDAVGTRTQNEAFHLSDKLDYHQYKDIAQACKDIGIAFFATPFDLEAVESLETIGVQLYKIASADLTYKELIASVAATGKPLILSTGAAELSEIEQAIEWAGLGPEKLVLLVCTLTYPCPDNDADLGRIETFREKLAPYLCGVSDHTLGIAGGWVSGSLGAVCIEKHYTIDKKLPDVPDHAISVDPSELAELVEACNRAATLRGESWIGVRESEVPARQFARRSIVTEKPIRNGEILTRSHVAFKRPGTGLYPSEVDQVIGRRVSRDLDAGTLIVLEDLE